MKDEENSKHELAAELTEARRQIRELKEITFNNKQTENSLTESEAQYRVLFETSPDPIIMYDLQGNIIMVNKQAAAAYGMSYPEEFMATYNNIMDILDDTDRNQAIDRLADLLQGNVIPKNTYKFLTRDGDCLIGEVNTSVIKDHHDHPRAFISIIHDVTLRRRMEVALLESERKYRLLAEYAHDIIFTMDSNLCFTYVSPSITRLRGFSVEEVMSHKLEDVLTPASWELAMKAYQAEMGIDTQETNDRQSTHILELEMCCKDGSTVWTETTLSLLYNEHNHFSGILGITRDISERKRVEAENKKLESQLFQAQKMESIGTLAGGIAHDFNNILAAIIGYSELALENISGPEKAKAEIREVLKAGDRAKNLVSQILTFSRQTKLTYSPLELPTLIKESLKMLRSVIPTSIEIRRDLIMSGLIMSDPTQMHQLMMNLCTNAAHAMDEAGGVLSISLHKDHIDIETARSLDIAPGRYLKLSVSDTGQGMPPEIMKRIFEPYYTTKELGRGTGLGLSVVHGIVKSHGGTITSKSAHGEGTTFDVYLPELELAMETPESKKEEAFPRGTERILYIDDEPALASLAEKILGGLGYEVTTVTSSLEALENFKAKPGQFDLVITDMTMPGMTGDKLAQKLMEIRPDIPVILCSGYSEHISAEKAESLGIRKFIMKPIQKKTMAETIKEVLGASSHRFQA